MVSARRQYLLRRLVWSVVAVWALLSMAFLVYAYTPDPNVPLIKFAAGYEAAITGENATQAQLEAVAAYREARNYDVPVWVRYRTWMVNYATLQWGWSFLEGKPVMAVIAARLPRTLAYVVPAISLSVLGGVLTGTYFATARGGLADRVGTALMYVGGGVPVFFLAELGLVLAVEELGWFGVAWDDVAGPWSAANLDAYLLPMAVLTLNLFAVQMRYARSETLEYVNEDFVKTLRSVGMEPLTVARHLLRNTTVPLVSVFFTETLTVLYVSVYVLEVAIGFPGIGQVFYEAIQRQDIGLILAQVLFPAVLAIGGNLLQDVIYSVVDPRIDVQR